MPGGRPGSPAGLVGEVHVDGELRPVAGGEVRVAVVGNRLVVDARIPRRRLIGVHRERPRLCPVRIQAHAVAGARRHVAEQQPAERVGSLRVEGLSPAVMSDICCRGCEAGDVHLLGAAERIEARGRRA